ncbi:response regulator [Methanofollis tationis]|uniref:Response regulator n=1 Tax=Methanofollis tationis TaxID=81417 RepID=A0A7K4HN34_9EURY|nr:response regulator [Methanofollis tationis]NVO66562.1 response regulator [Methanofollis tationis]
MTRVLIIDDSSFQRKIISSILTAEDYEIISAQNGQEGLKYLAGDLPDLMVLDLLMPQMDGIEVLAEMRERGIRVPVIVLTADIQDSTKKRCIELGAARFINKPVKKDELSATVREVLGVKEA